ncbi:MAG: Fe-S cluster assembly protein SufD [Oscillatoriales cyanobacterium RM2_1_1]|nr:Fe-S cluster assembly protein SufD [Oscillatoriales cyanobacterium RM2_1_1]
MIQAQEKLEVSRLNQWLDLAQGSTPLKTPGLQQRLQQQLQHLRTDAAATIRGLAIPTRQDEDWRFMDLSALLQIQFQAPPPVSLSLDDITGLTLPETNQSRLVFVNGIYHPELSNTQALPPEVFVGNLATLPDHLAETLEDDLAQPCPSQEIFTSLNTAGLIDGAVIWVGKNQVVDTPIQVLLIATSEKQANFNQPRVLVRAEAGSLVTVVEHFGTIALGCSDHQTQGEPYFTNAVAQFWLAENAEVNHVRIQRDGGNAFHIGRTAVFQGRSSRYRSHAISLGGGLSRHNLDVYQTGEATETVLNGLTLTKQTQRADTHSALFLNYPQGRYSQVHKLIADDQSSGVFNGRVIVPQSAQFTNASQLSQNLLLSPQARVNTKPQLEITADDVKCSHGATVSQLEEDEIFYLRSRGLDEETSRRLLVDGFSGELINQIPLESLRTMLSRCVACRVDLGL